MRALEQVANEVLPREMGFEWADLSYQQQKAAGTGTQTFVLSLVCVFLILAALYESWTLPFSVLLSLPIAVFGALAGLLLRKYDLDVYGQIGLVMLVGLSAKNAILIVEFAKGELEKGRPLMDAALEGARLRFRPVLMTSFAFIFGLLPLWIASGAGAVSRRILGTAVITGMLAATGIAIFIIRFMRGCRGLERTWQLAPFPPVSATMCSLPLRRDCDIDCLKGWVSSRTSNCGPPLLHQRAGSSGAHQPEPIAAVARVMFAISRRRPRR